MFPLQRGTTERGGGFLGEMNSLIRGQRMLGH